MKLEHIFSEVKLAESVRRESAWKLISDFSRFSSYSRNIDKVIVHEKTDNRGTTEWDVTFDGAPLNWTQKDDFDPKGLLIAFKSISGDFDKYFGNWRIKDSDDGGISVTFSADYNIGIPVIEELFGPIFKERIQKNINEIVHAVADQINRLQVEERSYKRFKIGTDCTINLDGRALKAHIIDISPKGLMLSCDRELESAVTVEICDHDIELLSIKRDHYNKNYRLVFKEEIDIINIETIAKSLMSRHIRTYNRQQLNEPAVTIY